MKGKYKISGWLYLIFGLLIAGYSKLLLNKSGSEKNIVFQFFFYIGLAFIAIGVFKTIIRYALGQKNKQLQEQNLNFNSDSEFGTQNNNTKFRLVTCPKCRTKNYATYNFCYNCGCRLK